MSAELRTPFFIMALIALAIAFLLEIGSGLVTGGDGPTNGQLQGAAKNELSESDRKDVDLGKVNPPKEARPGLGIRYLAFLDGLLLLTIGLMGLSLLLPERIHGRIQGIITLVVTLVDAVFAGLATFMVALPLLLTMVGLFLAAPFGTIAYLAIWGFFDRGAAAAVLGTLLFLKLAFAVLLVLAHQRFLANKGLVLLIVTSLVANLLLSFLHGFVPGILVSITDAVGAIVVGVLALIWAIVLLIGAIVAVVKALKLEKISS